LMSPNKNELQDHFKHSSKMDSTVLRHEDKSMDANALHCNVLLVLVVVSCSKAIPVVASTVVQWSL